MKKKLLKIFFTLISIILLFLFLSCSPNTVVHVGLVWKGEMDNFFSRFNDVEIYWADFFPDSEIDLKIKINDSGNSEPVEFEGTYYVNWDYSFKAVLNSVNESTTNSNIFFSIYGTDIRNIKYHLTMKGYLNGYTNEGYGDYDMNCTIYFEDGNVINDVKFDGDWELSR